MLEALAAEYEEELQGICALALDGRITRQQTQAELERVAVHYITAMYALGGGDPLSLKGRRYLDGQVKIHKRSARSLTRDIFSGRYAPKAVAKNAA